MSQFIIGHLKEQKSSYIITIIVVLISIVLSIKNTIHFQQKLILTHQLTLQTHLKNHYIYINKLYKDVPDSSQRTQLNSLLQSIKTATLTTSPALSNQWVTLAHFYLFNSELPLDNTTQLNRIYYQNLQTIYNYNLNIELYNDFINHGLVKLVYFKQTLQPYDPLVLSVDMLHKFEVVY